MKKHINTVTASCFYQLRRLRQVRRCLSRDATTQLVYAFITSKLDYCNSVLANLPKATIAPLQRVQNAAARLVLNLSRRDHISPALKQLHWLPIEWRIQFKLAVMMHTIHTGRCPAYMSDVVHTVANNSTRTGLRSSGSARYVMPRCGTFGEAAFSVSGPRAWNSLPPELHSITDLKQFKKLLKTHYFTLAF